MATDTRRARTSEILERYSNERAKSDTENLSIAEAANLEALITETVRLLRENKTMCVRDEQASAERIGGQRWAATGTIDLGYEALKAEIDNAINAMLAEKLEIRMARAKSTSQPAPEAPAVQAANDQLLNLADLHASGILTADEFAAAKARLV